MGTWEEAACWQALDRQRDKKRDPVRHQVTGLSTRKDQTRYARSNLPLRVPLQPQEVEPLSAWESEARVKGKQTTAGRTQESDTQGGLWSASVHGDRARGGS